MPRSIIDLAVEIVPKTADWDTHLEKNNDRAQELIMLGHHFRRSIEYAVCWQLEVFRFLKGRSRAISLADYNIEKRLVLAVPHRMLLGDDEPAPFLSEDSPVHASDAGHRTVRSDGRITVATTVGHQNPIWMSNSLSAMSRAQTVR